LLAAGIAAVAQAQPARFVLDAGGGKISVLDDDGSIWQAVGQQTRKSDTVTGQFLLPVKKQGVKAQASGPAPTSLPKMRVLPEEPLSGSSPNV
jgi:hypothetical protein